MPAEADLSQPEHVKPAFVRADGRVDIKSLTLAQLEAAMKGMGAERFRALQVYKWLWQKRVTHFSEMLNVSKKVLADLEERFYISFLEPAGVLQSVDGTTKFLWKTEDGHKIESVLIPDEDRLTLCVSTQVGCAMACSFCLTGDLGLKRHLRPSEIANQPLQVQRYMDAGTWQRPETLTTERVTNIVMMGMGEPLHNYDNLVVALKAYLHEHGLGYSHRKVTVSTVGLVPAMQKLAAESPVNIAVSLNATTEEQRRQVMPITRRYSMEELLDACRKLPLPKAKRITFEYVMMAGFNDSLEDAHRLVRLMRGIRSKVNLIPYNENPDRQIRRPSEAQVQRFQHILLDAALNVSVRATRGKDISAACGQLGKTEPGQVASFLRVPPQPSA
ncbi:MAG TPA: 23S rRNA (adenine(2503)-C(2))-methyltransferase RlmN [Myxococcota bacterium]|nr:23S rRNA (adenine(2503)-C(2))-methyltransferase RlmN [Myxococcota bacterium]HND28543.1 23S rRNA (adenine(2503)-C(2))-methyltransferase RlmN [Myxococcota bacterium]